MRLVVDASVVVALLVDAGPPGAWAATVVAGRQLYAPTHLAVEVANVLRRAVIAGRLSDDVAAIAHQDLLDLRVEQLPYEAVADRCWELRANVASYDAAYVAVAEVVQAPLATLDGRLARATGPICEFVTR